MTSETVAEAIRSYRFHYTGEKALQEGIAKVFTLRGIRFERERPIDQGVIDFFVEGGIGVEIKTKGSPSAVARQLISYAECAEVAEIVLITGRSRLGRLPEKILGKRLTVVTLWESFL